MLLFSHLRKFHVITGIILVLFITNIAFAQEEVIEEPINPFVDVTEGTEEYVAIKYLKDLDILKGYPDGSFQPYKNINRVEALKLILEANKLITAQYIEENKLGGSEYKSEPQLTFIDLYKSAWYFPYVKKAFEQGIVVGYEDNTFQPERTVNRVESFKMVMNSDGIPLPEVTENPFADVRVNDWFAPYLFEGKIREIVYTSMKNLVYPGYELTRAKFSGLVYRYLMSKLAHKFGKASYYHDSLEGRSTSSGEPYRASEFTAAHLTLPFHTMLKVTNVDNGKTVIVRVNDRGPFITGRVIDLSKAAFQEIGYLGSGVLKVEYEILNQEEYGG